MNIESILEVTKARLGITSQVRDSYITMIIKGVITELEDEKGIVLEPDNYNHFMFIVDYASYRYQNKENKTGVPRDLQFRLHNLVLHNRR